MQDESLAQALDFLSWIDDAHEIGIILEASLKIAFEFPDIGIPNQQSLKCCFT